MNIFLLDLECLSKNTSPRQNEDFGESRKRCCSTLWIESFRRVAPGDGQVKNVVVVGFLVFLLGVEQVENGQKMAKKENV